MSKSPTISELEHRISELEKEKAHLLKLVSHDVKSPFNKLFALSNLLQLTADNLNEEQQDYLVRMDWVIKEGLTVVRNLMDLRAIESSKVELTLEAIDLTHLLNDCLKGYAKQIATKNLEIINNSEKVTARSDRRMLEKVIDHLVSNAVKFTPQEQIITVNLSDDGSKAEFSTLSKSGPIPKDEADNLFQKSSPLSTRPTHGESALGNGLYIAQSYAHILGGNILMEQLGSEVEFRLVLPKK